MNYVFLESLKHSIESISNGLQIMHKNCKYITKHNLISNNNNYDFLLDYCVLACRFNPRILKGHENIIDLIDKQMSLECKHKWVTDWIDTSPDKSVKIVYCEYCECTKHQ